MGKLVDYRPLLFDGLPWYDQLAEDNAEFRRPWRIIRSKEPAWWVDLLSAAASFAQEQNVLEHFRRRLAGIPSSNLKASRAARENRSPIFPIWEIVNELIVGKCLVEALGWRIIQHQPRGRLNHRGDWEFATRTGREVFVEVKSLRETDRFSSGVYSKPDYRPRIRSALRHAYTQFPDDGRATLAILVGNWMLRIPHGIMHGDLFQALFGQIEIRFRVMPFDPATVQMGPSFREMLIHRTKHRRLAYAGALIVTGDERPRLALYVIQNPFAQRSVRLSQTAFAGIGRFVIDRSGKGREIGRTPHRLRMVADTSPGPELLHGHDKMQFPDRRV
jgi:hypothetical protein